jgi:hypothetical protein
MCTVDFGGQRYDLIAQGDLGISGATAGAYEQDSGYDRKKEEAEGQCQRCDLMAIERQQCSDVAID